MSYDVYVSDILRDEAASQGPRPMTAPPNWLATILLNALTDALERAGK